MKFNFDREALKAVTGGFMRWALNHFFGAFLTGLIARGYFTASQWERVTIWAGGSIITLVWSIRKHRKRERRIKVLKQECENQQPATQASGEDAS